MVDGMNQVLNAPGVEGPSVPVEVEVECGRSRIHLRNVRRSTVR